MNNFLLVYLQTFIMFFFFRSEVEQDDEVDSDFSIDENDEPVSDQEEDNKEGKKKRGRLITKAYKVFHSFKFCNVLKITPGVIYLLETFYIANILIILRHHAVGWCYQTIILRRVFLLLNSMNIDENSFQWSQ